MSAIRVLMRLRELLDVLVASPADGDVLTYETASSKWKNLPAAGGGAQPSVLTATVRLSSADILALDTTPVTLVDGVPGSAIVPVTLAMVLLYGGVAYQGSYNERIFVGPTFGGAGWGAGSLYAQAFNAVFSTSVVDDVATAIAGDNEALTLLDGQPVRFDTDAAVTVGTGTAVLTLSYFEAPLT